MANGKKSFIIYADLIHQIDHLSNEEKGILFQHLLEYVNDQNPVLEDRVLLSVWKPIQMQLKRDLKLWENKQKQRSEAGKRSAEVRKAKSTTVNDRSNRLTNLTVNDNVNDINNNNTDAIDIIFNRFVSQVKAGAFDTRVQALYMSLKIRDGSLTPLLKEFKNHLISENRLHKNTDEFFLNFKNWLNIKNRIKELDKYKH